jgi:hypothetical protein
VRIIVLLEPWRLGFLFGMRIRVRKEQDQPPRTGGPTGPDRPRRTWSAFGWKKQDK